MERRLLHATALQPLVHVLFELVLGRFQSFCEVIGVFLAHFRKSYVKIAGKGSGRAFKEGNAVEMVGFMLNNARFQSLPVVRLQLPLEIDRLKFDFPRARNNQTKFRIAQATFFVFNVAAKLENRRVDQHVFAVLLFAIAGGVDDNKSVRKVNLIGRQAYPVMLVHQIKHFSDYVANNAVNFFEGFALKSEHGMGIFYDAHSVFFPFVYNIGCERGTRKFKTRPYYNGNSSLRQDADEKEDLVMKRGKQSQETQLVSPSRGRVLRSLREWSGSSVGSLVFHAILLFVLFVALRSGTDGGLGKLRNTDEIGIVLSDSQNRQDDAQLTEEGGEVRHDEVEERRRDLQQTSSDASTNAESSVFLPSNEIGAGASKSDVVGDPLQRLSASSSSSQTSSTHGQVVGFGGAKGSGRKFVYVIDHSDSMSWRGGRPMRRALSEATASVKSLDAKQGANKFQIVVFNHDVEVFRNGSTLLDVTPQNKSDALKFLSSVSASGGTAPEQALVKALLMKPDVVFFLTDADEELPESSLAHLQEVRRTNNVKQICVIEFGQSSPTPKRSFRRLAAENGGDYVFRDVDQM